MSEYHNVQTIVRYMKYGELVKENILPKEKLFTQIKGGSTLPKLYHYLGYFQFYYFIKKLIKKIILQEEHDYIYKEFENMFSYKDLVKLVSKFDKSTIFNFSLEFKKHKLESRPFILFDGIIYELIIVDKFNGVRIETILKMLSSYCLARRLKNKIRGIGLILPLQNLIVEVELKGWMWLHFYNKMKEAIILCEKRENIIFKSFQDCGQEFDMLKTMHVGYHIEKNNLIEHIKHNTKLPLQFFLGGNMNTKLNFTQNFFDELKFVLSNYLKSKIFIHSPYTINLSREFEENDWISIAMKKLLNFGIGTGVKGVVVHCGQKVKLTEEKAIDNMLKYVNKISEYADENCQLLIETSAKEGGEILYNPEELSKFYSSINKDLLNKVSVCVDTAHVWAAGYHPMEFINILENNNVPIKLIHFNSNLYEFGCCIDRHASFDNGWIPYNELFEVLKWAISKNISLLIE